MTFSFNLIEQPWIPILWQDGRFEELSLWEALTHAHEIQDLCGDTPLVTAALYPLLLALLHRVYGPPDVAAWKALWQQGEFPPQPLEDYLKQWYESFDLFHPTHPFYQMQDERLEAKSVIYLAEAIANTAALFTHTTEEKDHGFMPAEAARMLLVAQAFRLGGGVAGSGTPNFVGSVFVGGILFFVKGGTLFETLMLNLMPYPSEIMPLAEDDKPVWENKIQRRGAKEMLFLAPQGYLDYLTWQTNHVWLFPEHSHEHVVTVRQVKIVPIAKLADETFSPQKLYRRATDKDHYYALLFNETKAVWRDFHSFIAFDIEGYKLPAVIHWLARLRDEVLPNDTVYPLMAVGMLADKAKPIFSRQEEMPLPLALLGRPAAYSAIEQAVSHAETAAGKLRYAVEILAHHVLMRGKEGKPDKNTLTNLVAQWDVLSLYWAQIEPSFWTFVMAVSHEDSAALTVWHKTLRRTALDALEQATRMAGRGAWALRGQIEAENALHGMLKKAFGD